MKIGRPESVPVMLWPAIGFTGLAKFADILSDAAPPIVRDAFQRQ
jgi:hypothetical protein